MTPYGEVLDRSELSEASEKADADLALPAAAVVCIGAIALAVWASAHENTATSGQESFRECATITQNSARLACYDNLTAPHQPAKGANAPVAVHVRQGIPH